jgi:hypothetical protein
MKTMYKPSLTLWGFYAAIILLVAQSGCSSVEQPSSASQQMIPLGQNDEWTYSIFSVDSLGNETPAGSQTESQTSYDLQYTSWKTYAWDSLGRIWEPFQNETGYARQADGYGDMSNYLIYTPYADGSENGILCGNDFHSEGGRYWFKLPQNPATSRTYSATIRLSAGYGTTNDSVGGLFRAELDPTRYSISVPAGNFQCYRLVLRFDGNMGAPLIDSLHNVGTIYLAPGKGIIKRVMSTVQMVKEVGNPILYPMDGYKTVYELSSLQIE